MFYWIGKEEVISVQKSFPDASELPDGFHQALDEALKKVIRESIDWNTVTVKKDLVGKEPVLRKTLGRPWSFSFVPRVDMRMLSLQLSQEGRNEVIRVLSVGIQVNYEGDAAAKTSAFFGSGRKE